MSSVCSHKASLPSVISINLAISHDMAGEDLGKPGKNFNWPWRQSVVAVNIYGRKIKRLLLELTAPIFVPYLRGQVPCRG